VPSSQPLHGTRLRGRPLGVRARRVCGRSAGVPSCPCGPVETAERGVSGCPHGYEGSPSVSTGSGSVMRSASGALVVSSSTVHSAPIPATAMAVAGEPPPWWLVGGGARCRWRWVTTTVVADPPPWSRSGEGHPPSPSTGRACGVAPRPSAVSSLLFLDATLRSVSRYLWRPASRCGRYGQAKPVTSGEQLRRPVADRAGRLGWAYRYGDL